jgi:hypothetical protein
MDKAVADLRDDLIEELKLINKYEAQIPVIASEDFQGVDDVVHVLGHIRDERKHAVATLVDFITKMDAGQKAAEDTATRKNTHTSPTTGIITDATATRRETEEGIGRVEGVRVNASVRRTGDPQGGDHAWLTGCVGDGR